MELIKSIFNWKFKQLLKVQTQLMEEKLNWKIHYVLIKLSVFGDGVPDRTRVAEILGKLRVWGMNLANTNFLVNFL
jgi:hypothetical protein